MIAEKTLGERILDGRKAAGLSQEGLGEKLNVSRQAVSKWESDAAIPELEKLIAMSRIFNVSVGRLLGVEPEADSTGESDALTERELKVVEQIAAKYAAETDCRKLGWTQKRKIAVGVIAACAVLTVVGIWRAQFLNIENRLDDLQSRVNQMQSIPVIVQSSDPNEEEPVLATCEIQLIDFDCTAETFTLAASARPLQWTESTSVIFTATTSKGVSASVECLPEQGAFSAGGWVVPMDEQLNLTATVTTDGIAHTEVLGRFNGCIPENFRLDVWGSWDARPSIFGSKVTFGVLQMEICRNSNDIFDHTNSLLRAQADLRLESVELEIYRNGAVTPEQTLPVENMTVGEFGQWSINTPEYTTGVKFEPGDLIVAAAKITDNWGQTYYAVLEALRCEKSGIVRDPAYGEIINQTLDCLDWMPGTKSENMAEGTIDGSSYK